MDDFMRVVRKFSKSDIQPEIIHRTSGFSHQHVFLFWTRAIAFSNLKERRYQRENVRHFFISMRPLVILGNTMGLMPLKNFSSRDVDIIHFSVKGWNFIYSVIIQVAILFLGGTSLYRQATYEVEFSKFFHLVYYIHASLTYMSFTLLAAKWKDLVRAWEEVELVILDELDDTYDPMKLRRKINRITIIYCILSIIAQILFRLNEYLHSENCLGFKDRMQAFFNQTYTELFLYVPYHLAIAVVASIASTLCTVSRMYLDLLLTAVCIALGELFQIFNRSVMASPIEVINQTFWQNKRKVYDRILTLLKNVNKKIDPLLVLAYAGNLLFICTQLLFCFRHRSASWKGAYGWFTVCVFTGRIIYLSLTAARINEASTEIVPFIRMLPSSVWNIEVQQFLDQLTKDRVALSGMKFFTITKPLILKIIGTIVTYELVLLQFQDMENEEHDHHDSCI